MGVTDASNTNINIHHRWFWIIIALLQTCQAKTPPNDKPHLILIVADDLGWNDVSWHNTGVLTPHLEDLARNGIILEQSYVLPICSPTRSALMTGRYPFTLGRQSGVIWPLMPTGLTLNATLLPEMLKSVGYNTHAVGKWHLGFCSWAYTPTNRGFDSFHGYYTGAEDYFTHIRTESGSTSNEEINKWMEGYDYRENRDPDFKAKDIYSAYDFADHVDNLLLSRDAKDPMFLYIPFQSVHAPLMVPSNYTDLYSHIHDHNRRTYLGMVTAMDEAVGKIVATLKKTGHYDNSVIVFTTDNGGPTKFGGNNWPLRGNKTTLWEGGTRGSAFVHSPLLKNVGTVSHQLIHATDWLATFVGLAGGTVPSNIDGIDQWAALMGDCHPPRTEMVYNIDYKDGIHIGYRMGDYKLLLGSPGPGDWTPEPNLKDGENVFQESLNLPNIKIYDNLNKLQEQPTKTNDKLNEFESSDDLHLKLKQFSSVKEILHSDIQVQLYNLKDDPEERQDLSAIEGKIVEALLMHVLYQYIPRVVPADLPSNTLAGDPANFDGVWSPGWC